MVESKVYLSLDIQDFSTNHIVPLKCGETGKKVVISLSDGGFPYHIEEGCYAVLTGEKPDGNVLFNHCDIDGDTIFYDVSEQTTAAAGRILAAINLYGPDDMLIVSAKFRIMVDGTVFHSGKVESAPEVTALTHLISDAKTTIVAGNEMIKEADSARDDANAAAEKANTAAEAANTAAQAAGTAASGANDARDAANAAAEEARNAKQEADTARDGANTAAEAANTAAENAQAAVVAMGTELSKIKGDLSDKLPKSPANWEPWTAEEQAAARDRIGIPGDFELIEEIVVEDDVSNVRRTIEPDGTPYNFKKMFVYIQFPEVLDERTFYSTTKQNLYFSVSVGANRAAFDYCDCSSGVPIGFFMQTNDNSSPSKLSGYPKKSLSAGNKIVLTGYTFGSASADYPIYTGTVIKIYGVRA